MPPAFIRCVRFKRRVTYGTFMKRITAFHAWALIFLLGASAAATGAATDDQAVSPEERGRVIAEKVRQSASGFDGLSARLRMTLENRRGQTSERLLRFRILERSGGGTYTLCRVDAPPDVRGTALLSHSHPDAENHQWLYMPAVQRTRRIAAQGRSGAFMGSEFSYEDLSGRPMENHSAVWLRDERHQNRLCHVIEFTPPDPRNTGYSRTLAWVDTEAYRIWRVDYYNRRGERLKTLTMSEYALYDDHFWHAAHMEMANHLTGNRTQLEWSDLEIGVEMDPTDFERDRLPTLR